MTSSWQSSRPFSPPQRLVASSRWVMCLLVLLYMKWSQVDGPHTGFGIEVIPKGYLEVWVRGS